MNNINDGYIKMKLEGGWNEFRICCPECKLEMNARITMVSNNLDSLYCSNCYIEIIPRPNNAWTYRKRWLNDAICLSVSGDDLKTSHALYFRDVRLLWADYGSMENIQPTIDRLLNLAAFI